MQKKDLGGHVPHGGRDDLGTSTEDQLSHVQQAIAELDAILVDQRMCFAEDSVADRFLGHVTRARQALLEHADTPAASEAP